MWALLPNFGKERSRKVIRVSVIWELLLTLLCASKLSVTRI